MTGTIFIHKFKILFYPFTHILNLLLIQTKAIISQELK